VRGVAVAVQVGQLLDEGSFEAALLLCDLLVVWHSTLTAD